MNLKITFSELQNLVLHKTGKEILLTAQNENTLNIQYRHRVHIPIVGERMVEINVNTTIDKFEEGKLYLTYESSMGIELILKGILTIMRNLSTTNLIETAANSQVIVHLSAIDKVQTALEHVDVQSILVEQDGINIYGALVYDPRIPDDDIDKPIPCVYGPPSWYDDNTNIAP